MLYLGLGPPTDLRGWLLLLAAGAGAAVAVGLGAELVARRWPPDRRRLLATIGGCLLGILLLIARDISH